MEKWAQRFQLSIYLPFSRGPSLFDLPQLKETLSVLLQDCFLKDWNEMLTLKEK